MKFSMRFSVLVILLCAALLPGCANHGIIVQKESRPHPFYLSVGVEALYTFVLRDEAGVVHRQMVTPEVYERYAVGQNFNDEAPAPATNDVMEPKTVQVAMHQPTFSVGRIASAPPTSARPLVSVKSQTPVKSHVALKSTHSKHIASHRIHKKTVAAHNKNGAHKHKKIASAHSKKVRHAG